MNRYTNHEKTYIDTNIKTVYRNIQYYDALFCIITTSLTKNRGISYEQIHWTRKGTQQTE